MCNSTYANGTTLIESQPFVLLLVGVTNVTFNGFSPDNLAPWFEPGLVSIEATIGVQALDIPASCVFSSYCPWLDGGTHGAEEGDVVSIWSHVGVPPDILVACHGCDGRRGAVEMEVHNVSMGP